MVTFSRQVQSTTRSNTTTLTRNSLQKDLATIRKAAKFLAKHAPSSGRKIFAADAKDAFDESNRLTRDLFFPRRNGITTLEARQKKVVALAEKVLKLFPDDKDFSSTNRYKKTPNITELNLVVRRASNYRFSLKAIVNRNTDRQLAPPRDVFAHVFTPRK